MKHIQKRKFVNHVIRKNLDVEGSHYFPFFEKAGIPIEMLRTIPASQWDKKNLNYSASKLTDVTIPHWIQRQENEFTAYLKKLLIESKYFSEVRSGEIIGKETPFKSDIIAKIKTKSGWENILIECKNDSSFSRNYLVQRIEEIRQHKKVAKMKRSVLAFPGRISRKLKQMLDQAGIELWDIDFMAVNFTHEIGYVKNPYFQPLFKSYYTVFPGSQAEKYIKKLQSCKYGKENLPAYKIIVGQILRYLFNPPLAIPVAESSEHPRTNGSYLVIPNYASDGFWTFMRETYRADYIIVDVKNYKGKVRKRDALLLANYLKFYGAGLFGIIIARNGYDANCLQALKEQWVADSKLIVVLNDEDIEEMILAKSAGGSAESILGRVIEHFRIAL